MEASRTQRPHKRGLNLPALETGRRAGSIAEQVYRSVRHAIVTMKFPPGTALSEQEVARELDVSRQPVREAFIKLSEAGLLNVVPQRGTFVMKISPQAVLDARFVREAVECAIVRRAASGIAANAIAGLRKLIARQHSAATAGDPETLFVLDEAFHRDLANAAGCAYAWKVVEAAKAQMDRVRYLRLAEATPMHDVVRLHEEIVNAIAARRADEAEAAMQVHLRGILRTLPRFAREVPDMFDPDELAAMDLEPAATEAPRAKRRANAG